MYKFYAHWNSNNYLLIPNLTFPQAYEKIKTMAPVKSKSITRQWNNTSALIVNENGVFTSISPRVPLP